MRSGEHGPSLWRQGALTALLAAVTLDHYTFEVAGLHVKLEHVVLAALLAAAAWGLVRGHWRPARGPLTWIALLLAVTLLSSLLNAPDRVASLRHTGMVALVASGAWLVYGLTDTPARLRGAVRLLIGLGGLEAALAFGALVAAWFNSSFGTQPGMGGMPVPYGTLWEPNFLGSYLAAAGALTLAGLLGEHDRRRAAGLAGGLALLLAALALSLARAAWIGFLLGAGVVLIGWWQSRPAPGPVFARNARLAACAGLVALAFLAGVAPLLFPATTGSVFARVDPRVFNPPGDPSLQRRASATSQAWTGILAHPLIGNGAGSYAADHVNENGDPGWLANLEVHLLYDSGVLGLGAFVGGMALLGWAAWRGLCGPSAEGADLRPAAIGLLSALAALAVAYQATEGTWLGFTWVYVGLLARVGVLMRAAVPDAAMPPGGALPGSDNSHDPSASAPAFAAAGPAGVRAGHRHTSGRT